MGNSILHTPIEYLKGVGPQRGETIRKELGIHFYKDFINFFPNRYIDKTRYYKINQIQDSTAEIQIIGKVVHIKSVASKNKKTSRLVATFVDETGEMELVWFRSHQWITENVKLNTPYVIFGRTNKFGAIHSMAHPEMELLVTHEKNTRITMLPIYPSTEKLQKKGITNKTIHNCVQQVLTETHQLFGETLPVDLCHELNLISKRDALINIHFPKNNELLSKAQFRLKFEELYFIQLQLITKNLVRKTKIKGNLFETVGEHFNNFYNNHLPFELTRAQKNVLKEIRNDVGSNAQMNRLLQGDVGSGKTIVGFMCMLLALDNGFQACLVAPTEILANQHFNGIIELAKPLGINVKLLTGSSKTTERKIIHQELEDGSLDILIGTHAVLEDKVIFKNLGLAIIDEQHRFGVKQRAKLWKKNNPPPHILVMTATPIPRTLAMSLYGDLDISVIDELPPGRKPIQTVHRYENQRTQVFNFVEAEIKKGRQVYMVFPLIEESETLDYKNLMHGFEVVSDIFPLPEYAVSIVHGQMKAEDKDFEMQRFIEGKTNILVATTVIEVGVNVPNASVMIIESAERFGLSQLHQLRGRVGRGAEQSYCILMTSHKLSADSRTRIETMTQTNDGFEIAEVDLKLRGPGDLMGTQQSGVLNLHIADLVKDKDILQQARHYAIKTLRKDPLLSLPEHEHTKIAFDAMSKTHTIWNYIS